MIYQSQEDSTDHNSDDSRYIIIANSVSAHCCFEYTIIDTKQGKASYANRWEKQICETFEEPEAILICNALNRTK